MKQDKAELDWKTLIEKQPVVALIPTRSRELARVVETSIGETLFRIGVPVQWLFIVVSGEVRLIRRGRNGGEVILQRSRGGVIAEASLDSRAYHCDAISTEKGMLLQFPANAFRSTLEGDPKFRKTWQSLLAGEIRKLRAQCERLSLKTAEDRIIHYIETEGSNGAIELLHSRKAWAAELGLSHEALYRALRRMRENKVLHVVGNQFAI